MPKRITPADATPIRVVVVTMAVPPELALSSDEDDLSLSGVQVERRDALDTVDERIELLRFETQNVH